MSTTTPIYALTLPAVNSSTDEDLWGTEVNSNFSSLDTIVGAKLNSASPVWTGTASGTSISITNTAYLTSGVAGTTTNDSASVGIIGQLLESEILVGAAVSLTTATAANVTSISLTAGDWDVWGNVIFNPSSATPTAAIAAINTTSATLPTAPAAGAYSLWSGTTNTGISGFAQRRISVSSTTVVYLIAYSIFTGSTQTAYGYIGARRRR